MMKQSKWRSCVEGTGSLILSRIDFKRKTFGTDGPRSVEMSTGKLQRAAMGGAGPT